MRLYLFHESPRETGTQNGPVLRENSGGRPVFATPAAPYRSLPGPPGPESRKTLQRVSRGPGLSGPGSKAVSKQSRSLETVYFETPETVSRLFRTLFSTPRPRARGPGDSCKGRPGVATLSHSRIIAPENPSTPNQHNGLPKMNFQESSDCPRLVCCICFCKMPCKG